MPVVLVWLVIMGWPLAIADLARADLHPDHSRFEYRYINGAFIAPYRSFPEGRERSEWRCYEMATKRTVACTFIHRGFERFQYIFRPR